MRTPSASSLPAIVIEPDRETRTVLARMLGALGARVAAVGAPLAARASAAHRAPALVLLGPGVDDATAAEVEAAESLTGPGRDLMRLRDADDTPDDPRAHRMCDASVALRAWAAAHDALAAHARTTRLVSQAVLGSPDPVLVVEFPPRPVLERAVVAAANPAAAALLGCPGRDPAGDEVRTLPGARSLDRLLRACERAVGVQALQELEIEVEGRHLACRVLPSGTSATVTTADISAPRRDVERRDALSKVADGVAHALPFPTLCRMVCGLVATHLRADQVVVGRRDGERVRPVAVNPGMAMTAPGPADGAVSALAVACRAGSPTRAAFPPGARDGRPTAGTVEEVAVPIIVDGETWGGIAASADTAGRIPPDAEALLESMAHLLAVAIGHDAHRQELITHARTDGLTGLPNRRAFEERLDEEVARATRHGRPLALAIFDVDHFKSVNDTHGHGAGDRVLRELALRLARMARVGDLVARLGGEEFAWLMPDTDARSAFAAIDRARAEVGSADFPDVGHVTVSVGVCDLEGGPSRDDLYRNADQALYRAKRRGRDRTERHLRAPSGPSGPEERAARRAQACLRIARALGWGETRAHDLHDAVIAVEGASPDGMGAVDPHLLWSVLSHEGWDAVNAHRVDPSAVLAAVRVWDAPSAGSDRERDLRLRNAAHGLEPAVVAALTGEEGAAT